MSVKYFIHTGKIFHTHSMGGKERVDDVYGAYLKFGTGETYIFEIWYFEIWYLKFGTGKTYILKFGI